VVRHGDNKWGDLVRWSFFAMLVAEEHGITQANVDDVKSKNGTDNPNANAEVQRLLGITPGYGKGLGVDDNWAVNIIKAVGNYGESFERNVGSQTKLKLERGLNALWTKGGLQYAPPVN
jgi:general L-amino acid transport system substrate-binding protein